MLLAGSAACLLAFAPALPTTRMVATRTHSAAIARSRPMVAPMDITAGDLPFLEFMLPQHMVADQALRHVAYGFRIFAGATGFDDALVGAELFTDLRMLATASTVGTVRSFRGLAAAVSSAGTSGINALTCLQHSAMLLHHPIMIGKWASKFVAPAAAPTLAITGRSVCAGLWLVWIAAFAMSRLQQLKGSTGAERHTVVLSLRKLAVDVPLATHFLMGATLFPLLVVGCLGSVSSLLGIRAALADPNKPPAPRLALPLPRWPMRRLAVAGPGCATVGGPRPALVSCVAAAAQNPRCAQQQRRRIGGGPLSSSCEW